MSMVHKPRSQNGRYCSRRVGVLDIALAMLMASCLAAPVAAQRPTPHYLHAGVLEPGAIGRQQLMRGGPLSGYVQPVEIKAPPGALVSLAADGAFEEPQATPRRAGMLLAPVYRLRVTNIPRRPGEEVFPTVELIDRVYPPPGQEVKFAIPIEITQQDLELALAGRFITRVIYVEHPDAALPAAEVEEQLWFDVPSNVDPVAEADRLGRPVAILRLGGRLPDQQGPDDEFLYGSPPWISYDFAPDAAAILKQRSAGTAGR